MRAIIYICITLILVSCSDTKEAVMQEDNLESYLGLHEDLVKTDLKACASGNKKGVLEDVNSTTSIFFHILEGATDFRYYESDIISDPTNFSNYSQKIVPHFNVYSGDLKAFKLTPFVGEKMVVVTYKTSGVLHKSDPIRIKTNDKPTEFNEDLVTIHDQDTASPRFIWKDGLIDENEIYFQAISDENNNLVSGTYTYDQYFLFYNTDNVVNEVTNQSTTPVIVSGKKYKFILMAISSDNWVNLIIEKEFELSF